MLTIRVMLFDLLSLSALSPLHSKTLLPRRLARTRGILGFRTVDQMRQLELIFLALHAKAGLGEVVGRG